MLTVKTYPYYQCAHNQELPLLLVCSHSRLTLFVGVLTVTTYPFCQCAQSQGLPLLSVALQSRLTPFVSVLTLKTYPSCQCMVLFQRKPLRSSAAKGCNREKVTWKYWMTLANIQDKAKDVWEKIGLCLNIFPLEREIWHVKVTSES